VNSLFLKEIPDGSELNLGNQLSFLDL
jgi:hypothetical protein